MQDTRKSSPSQMSRGNPSKIQGNRFSQHHAGAEEAGITRAALQILPCTVSQLLSSAEVDSYVIGGRAVHQASIVGVVRRRVPFKEYLCYAVDDMTGPPVDVKLWLNADAAEAAPPRDAGRPGAYVKVVGSLRSSKGQRSLAAHNIRRLEDPNEITSHMLEVVQAHMQPSERVGGTPLKPVEDESQVLNVINMCPRNEGISLDGIRTKLDHLSLRAIRRSLEFLTKEGHIFTTIDEQHFKSIESG